MGTNNDFKWTDKLVKDFSLFHIEDFVQKNKWPEDTNTLLAKFKQSHTPKPQPHKEEQAGIFDLLTSITDKYQYEKIKYQMLERKVDTMCEEAFNAAREMEGDWGFNDSMVSYKTYYKYKQSKQKQ